jgi:hypothetical protein
MIVGFEDFTVEITPEEQYVVNIIIKRFQTKVGKTNIVTADKIALGLKAHFGIEFKESRIRKMIQYIRLNNLVSGLVATSKGYFVAQSPDEIMDWIDSLKSRENAIRKIREQAEQHIERLNNRNIQQSLF